MKQFFTLTLVASAIAWAQDAPKLNARELFYAPPPPAAGVTTTSQNQPASGAAKTGTTAGNTTSKARPGAGSSGANSGSTQTAQTTGGGRTPSTSSATPPSNTGGGNTIQIAQPNLGEGHALNISSTNSPAGLLGLRYAVLKRDSSGVFKEIDPDTTFRTGDAIRLHVESNTSGYLYVVNQGASGQWQLLFPRPDVSNGSNHVDPHAQITVPSEKAVWRFDEHPGTEKLFVVLARQPEPDLDKLIYSIQGGNPETGGRQLLAQNTIRNDVVDHLRGQVLSRDLVFEKVDENTSDTAPVKNETAAYVVSTNPAPDARLVKDFALQHR